jgi:RNA polymerase sigma-70 factor (ECF subfamily)
MQQTAEQIAFADLIRKNKGIVYSLCRRHLPLSEVDDHAQTIMAKAWVIYPTFKYQCKFSTWLYKVSLYSILDILRYQSKRKDLLEYVGAFFDYHDLPDENEQHIKDLQSMLLNQEIRKLPKEDQELIYHYMDGRPYTYISEVMGKNENMLRVRMSRIKSILKSVFIKQH